jgi:hypothetical protein
MALPPSSPHLRPGSQPRRACATGGERPRLASPGASAPPPPRPWRTWQALDRRERRRRPRAHRVYLGEHDPNTPTTRTGEHCRLNPTTNPLEWGGRRRPTGGTSAFYYAIPTRDPSARQLTTGHCPAVPTRASQSDQLSLPSRRPPDSSQPTTMTPNNNHYNRSLDAGVHLSSAARAPRSLG